jgi:hypothetical protein
MHRPSLRRTARDYTHIVRDRIGGIDDDSLICLQPALDDRGQAIAWANPDRPFLCTAVQYGEHGPAISIPNSLLKFTRILVNSFRDDALMDKSI